MNAQKTPNELLLGKLRQHPRVRVQNTLMRIGDRPIALGMMYMEDNDRDFVFSHLPAPKVERIRDELALQKRLKITYDQYRKAVQSLLDALNSETGGDSFRSYIRPKPRP